MESSYLDHVDLSVSKEIKAFVKCEVFANEYLFYKGRGEGQKAYCTMCEKEFDSSSLELKHNAEGICPICITSVKAKNLRYGRKNCEKKACFYYFEKSKIDKEVLICKGYYVRKRYEDNYKEPITEYELMAVYIFGDGQPQMYKSGWDKGFVKRASIFDFNNSGFLANLFCYCSFESFHEAIKDTKYQYMPFKMYEGRESLVKLIETFDKYPFIEQLSKIGLGYIVNSILRRNSLYRCLNFRGKNIYKILRLSKGDLRKIRQSGENVTPIFLRLYQMQILDKSNLTPKQVKDIEITYSHVFFTLEEVLRYGSMKKVTSYIDKQDDKHSKKNNKLIGRVNVLIAYRDYINACKTLGIELNKDVLYPSNVYKAHDDAITKIKVKENKKFDKLIQEKIDKLTEKYMFEKNGLVIMPAKSTKELIKEGEELKHCVATNYAKTYAEGRTIILLVRRVEEIDKPFVTVEVNRGKVIQCRAKRNKTAPEEVLSFMEEFKKEKLNIKAIAA